MGLAAALFLSSAFDTLLSLCLAGNRFGIVLLSLFFVIQLFFAGGILPLHYLSPSLRAVGRALPLGLSYALSAPVFGAVSQWTCLLWLLLWGVPVWIFAVRRQKRVCTEGGRSV